MSYDYYGSPNPKRLYRSRTDSVLGGVCGGIAERYDWDPILVRIIAIVMLFSGVGSGFIVPAYIVAWIVIPKAPRVRAPLTPEEDEFWRGVSDRPRVTFSNLKYTFMDLEDRLQNLERSVTSDEWRLRKEFRDLERR